MLKILTGVPYNYNIIIYYVFTIYVIIVEYNMKITSL